jgi:hypothetical protein
VYVLTTDELPTGQLINNAGLGAYRLKSTHSFVSVSAQGIYSLLSMSLRSIKSV